MKTRKGAGPGRGKTGGSGGMHAETVLPLFNSTLYKMAAKMTPDPVKKKRPTNDGLAQVRPSAKTKVPPETILEMRRLYEREHYNTKMLMAKFDLPYQYVMNVINYVIRRDLVVK